MIVLDASVLIAQFETSDSHHLKAKALLGASVGEVLASSVLSVAEALVMPARARVAERAHGALKRLGVETIPLHEDDPGALAKLRAETGLPLPDCCVLLSAEKTGSSLATFDDRLAAVARSRGMVVRGA